MSAFRKAVKLALLHAVVGALSFISFSLIVFLLALMWKTATLIWTAVV